jgi:hypothetical protein
MVFRTQKLARLADISASAAHCFRELPTPNADPKRTKQNLTVGAASRDQVMVALAARLEGVKIPRKDSPRVIEYLISASPEFFGEVNEAKRQQFFQNALTWLRKTHGEENVISATLHFDEATPHMSAFVVPITPDGQLSAKHFLGGKAKLSALQTSAWEAAGKPAGLRRGELGSKARHMDTNRWKAQMGVPVDQPVTVRPPKARDFLSPETYAQAEVDRANKKLEAAAIQKRAAKLAEQQTAEERKRLKAKADALSEAEASLATREKKLTRLIRVEGEKIAEAGLRETLKELQELRKTAAEAEKMKEGISAMQHDRKELVKTCAVLIKESYKGAELVRLAHELGVPAPKGKADIFDALRDAGRATTLEQGLTIVSEHLNKKADMKYRLSDLGIWAMDYEREEKRLSNADTNPPPRMAPR